MGPNQALLEMSSVLSAPTSKFGFLNKMVMLQSLFSVVLAAVMWVQVPQWEADWSQCSVEVPDVDCHWYVTAPDNTFGEGFSWGNAPWFSPEGLLDVAGLKNTMNTIQQPEHGLAPA